MNPLSHPYNIAVKDLVSKLKWKIQREDHLEPGRIQELLEVHSINTTSPTFAQDRLSVVPKGDDQVPGFNAFDVHISLERLVQELVLAIGKVNEQIKEVGTVGYGKRLLSLKGNWESGLEELLLGLASGIRDGAIPFRCEYRAHYHSQGSIVGGWRQALSNLLKSSTIYEIPGGLEGFLSMFEAMRFRGSGVEARATSLLDADGEIINILRCSHQSLVLFQTLLSIVYALRGIDHQYSRHCALQILWPRSGRREEDQQMIWAFESVLEDARFSDVKVVERWMLCCCNITKAEGKLPYILCYPLCFPGPITYDHEHGTLYMGKYSLSFMNRRGEFERSVPIKSLVDRDAIRVNSYHKMTLTYTSANSASIEHSFQVFGDETGDQAGKLIEALKDWYDEEITEEDGDDWGDEWEEYEPETQDEDEEEEEEDEEMGSDSGYGEGDE